MLRNAAGVNQTGLFLRVAALMSSGTAKTHVAHILAKLEVRDRVAAVVLAYESGALRPGA